MKIAKRSNIKATNGIEEEIKSPAEGFETVEFEEFVETGKGQSKM
jgi:hypothetical protein